MASASFKHGRYSEALPARLRETYDAVVNDPDLLELRSAIAMTDALIIDRLRTLDTGESAKLWAALGKARDDLRQASTRPLRDAAMLRMMDLIEQGQRHGTATDDLMTLVDNRRKLVRDEARRLKDMSAMVTADQAMALVGAIATLVRDHVTDPTALRAIQNGMTGLLARQYPTAATHQPEARP